MSGAVPVSLVIPLRWEDDRALGGMTRYLEGLVGLADEVVVVDGSPGPLFARHADAWRRCGGRLRHLRPSGSARCANGKVAGVRTGVAAAANEKVVVADDDVRYDPAALRRVCAELDRADLVRPQNYFDPLPWHAVWDTGRTLLNRAFGHDYPGTFGLRRTAFLRMGGYDGNVLFENLELIRTVRASGGSEARPLDLYVRRLPPESGRFWSQRLRQAYDDTAQPARMALFLALGPLAGLAALRAPVLLPCGAAAVVLLAEAGRRRAGGAAVFPAAASLAAPVWVCERAVCAWPALAARLTGTGVAYAGSRLAVAAHSRGRLRRRAGGAPALREPRGGEPDGLVGAVAERPGGRGPAPAQRNGAPPRRDGASVTRQQPERPSDQ
ncbi:glycosyl transferase family 21 [Actinorugispora endophytica]|uniref:Glycosyl transferase family 21 n=1 Tax=Actinorugispora endophytica TaxID=1605990 RepID=A0A4R6V5J7_9ACTN|nr:glycosyl transferase family 21 [Actinorugispora endophytica]